MTVDEIRAIKFTGPPESEAMFHAIIMREIAAQLAELNAKTAFLETASKLERIASALEGLERK